MSILPLHAEGGRDTGGWRPLGFRFGWVEFALACAALAAAGLAGVVCGL
jgi:hypothetical protein